MLPLQHAEAMLSLDLAFAEESGFMYGVKLVRGAYMEQERVLAREKGYPDPIWPSKTDTDDCYNYLLDKLLRCSQQKLAHIMVASHNEQTISFATQKYINSACVYYAFVGSCLATKFLIGSLPAMGRGWVIIK